MGSKKINKIHETHEKNLGKSENDKKYCKKKNFVQVDSVLLYGHIKFIARFQLK